MGIEEIGYSLLCDLMFLLCCGCYWKDRRMLLVGLMLAMPLYGCAAVHVMVASYEDESAKCAGLEKELGVAQARMQKLKATDSTDRNIRNFFFGSGWVHHPATWNHKRGFAFDRFLCGRLHGGKNLEKPL